MNGVEHLCEADETEIRLKFFCPCFFAARQHIITVWPSECWHRRRVVSEGSAHASSSGVIWFWTRKNCMNGCNVNIWHQPSRTFTALNRSHELVATGVRHIHSTNISQIRIIIIRLQNTSKWLWTLFRKKSFTHTHYIYTGVWARNGGYKVVCLWRFYTIWSEKKVKKKVKKSKEKTSLLYSYLGWCWLPLVFDFKPPTKRSRHLTHTLLIASKYRKYIEKRNK